MAELSERQRELATTMVALSEEDTAPLEIGPGQDTLDDPRWPGAVPKPSRDEIRSIVGMEYLEIDKSAPQGVWRFLPAEAAREEFGGDDTLARAEALKDPDARLGAILDAIVSAFESDPATPLRLFRTMQADLVRHPNWPIEPDVVQMHDLRQLELLELIGWEGETAFFPTPQGRMASKNQAAFLAQRAERVEDEEERSRLSDAAERFRAGDVAVGTVGGLTAAAIRALLGF